MFSRNVVRRAPRVALFYRLFCGRKQTLKNFSNSTEAHEIDGALMIDHKRLREFADLHNADYAAARPCPHTIIDNFLTPETVTTLARELDQADWRHYSHYNEKKQGADLRRLSPIIDEIFKQLNAPEFLDFLSRLTGIEELIADELIESGGIHQSTRGGFLNIHSDFTVHPLHLDWHRRLNVLIYIHEDWDAAWGGALELWAPDMSECQARYAPVTNRCVIFNTSDRSYHGHPEPMTCPQGVYRRSIALYYYTRDDAVKIASTTYRARPQDGPVKRLLMKSDMLLLRLYFWLKRRLKISDVFFTYLMGKGKKS